MKLTLHFVDVNYRLPSLAIKDAQCLCYSPEAQTPYRIMAGQFVGIATDCTHWAVIPKMPNPDLKAEDSHDR